MSPLLYLLSYSSHSLRWTWDRQSLNFSVMQMNISANSGFYLSISLLVFSKYLFSPSLDRLDQRSKWLFVSSRFAIIKYISLPFFIILLDYSSIQTSFLNKRSINLSIDNISTSQLHCLKVHFFFFSSMWVGLCPVSPIPSIGSHFLLEHSSPCHWCRTDLQSPSHLSFNSFYPSLFLLPLRNTLLILQAFYWFS